MRVLPTRARGTEARMKRFGLFVPLTALVVCASFPQTQAQQNAEKTELRGWLSDEGCAGERAHSGLYTGTNPDCAKKCVHEGKKVVLVDPDHKRLLTIVNPDTAMDRVGDYVAISGNLNEPAKTLRIDSLKLLEKGRAMCEKPANKTVPGKSSN
jgi:hypothetical protein